MKLKTFANIMFALFITITTSYSQTGVWLVQEGNKLYYESPRSDAPRDTLAYFDQQPSVTPLFAKTAYEEGSVAIDMKSRREFSSVGLKYRNGYDETRITYAEGVLSEPVTTFIATEEYKWNFLFILSLPIYFISLWVFIWVCARMEKDKGDPSAKNLIAMAFIFVIWISAGYSISFPVVYSYPENLGTYILLFVALNLVVTIHSSIYNIKRNKIGYSSLYRNSMN